MIFHLLGRSGLVQRSRMLNIYLHIYPYTVRKRTSKPEKARDVFMQKLQNIFSYIMLVGSFFFIHFCFIGSVRCRRFIVIAKPLTLVIRIEREKSRLTQCINECAIFPTYYKFASFPRETIQNFLLSFFNASYSKESWANKLCSVWLFEIALDYWTKINLEF